MKTFYNKEVRRRAGIERELVSKADQRVSRWFGHVERMDDYRMARRVLISGGGWMICHFFDYLSPFFSVNLISLYFFHFL